MRLTLRTLLAYLDDTLEPAQARLIGQKVAESDTAQELISRIKQVTRRRRLTTPPPTGPGSRLDPNTVADYLDNTLAPDQLAEVEQTCLGSDAHLAEIAACHQILTLVLGEPALIPPTSRQRMYGLVKGPESIPFRRPAATDAEEAEEPHEVNPEADETLRLGLPAYRRGGSWSSRLTLLGGALAAALLLGLAIWMALRLPEEHDVGPYAQEPSGPRSTAPVKSLSPLQGASAKEQPTAAEQPAVKPTPEPVALPKATEPAVEPKTVTPKVPEVKGDVKVEPPEKSPKTEVKPLPPEPQRVLTEVPVEPASGRETEVGRFLPVADDGQGLLLQRQASKDSWRVLDERGPKVTTGKPLVSLPGYRSVVQLNSGLRLTLWGNVPEQIQNPPVHESLVELHAHPDLDLDLTLRRGRIVVSNPEKKPLRARVRWDNPTNPQMPEAWDVTLEEPGSEVLFDRWGQYTRDEPFYKDPQDKRRVGPMAAVGMIVLKGPVSLRRDNSTVRLEADPPAKVQVVVWNSFKGSTPPQAWPLPDSATPNPPLPKGMDPKPRENMNKSLKALVKTFSGQGDAVKTSLGSAYLSRDPTDAVLAVRCFGALDLLPNLIDALADGERTEVRLNAMLTLRDWIAAARNNDYVLLEALQRKYQKGEAENMLSLLHNLSEREAADPATYDVLIDYLDNQKLPIREMAAWHLYLMTGNLGTSIQYSAVASPEQRRAAQEQWRKLLKEGKLPPRPMSPPAPGG